MSKKLVIIPTYNEKENVQQMIDTVMNLPLNTDLLIIDDNSPDGTAALVKAAQSKYPQRLHLLERAGKLGLGTAYIAGFKYALEHNYD
ncbi:MAG: glycosyltransferase, partial [Muribaculaceae bacterium]|nr:glycosyltransferase [Muribaculaceae bacterium]